MEENYIYIYVYSITSLLIGKVIVDHCLGGGGCMNSEGHEVDLQLGGRFSTTMRTLFRSCRNRWMSFRNRRFRKWFTINSTSDRVQRYFYISTDESYDFSINYDMKRLSQGEEGFSKGNRIMGEKKKEPLPRSLASTATNKMSNMNTNIIFITSQQCANCAII